MPVDAISLQGVDDKLKDLLGDGFEMLLNGR